MEGTDFILHHFACLKDISLFWVQIKIKFTGLKFTTNVWFDENNYSAYNCLFNNKIVNYYILKSF